MQSEFGLWVYNIIISKEFVSSICGGAIAGILSLLIAKLTLSSEFKNQRKMDNIQARNLEKSAFLMLKDELQRNRIIIDGYNKYYLLHSEASYVKVNAINIGSPEDMAWKEIRKVIFLSGKKELIDKIARHYHVIFMMQSNNNLTIESLQSSLDKIDSIIRDIDNLKFE